MLCEVWLANAMQSGSFITSINNMLLNQDEPGYLEDVVAILGIICLLKNAAYTAMFIYANYGEGLTRYGWRGPQQDLALF